MQNEDGCVEMTSSGYLHLLTYLQIGSRLLLQGEAPTPRAGKWRWLVEVLALCQVLA